MAGEKSDGGQDDDDWTGKRDNSDWTNRKMKRRSKVDMAKRKHLQHTTPLEPFCSLWQTG